MTQNWYGGKARTPKKQIWERRNKSKTKLTNLILKTKQKARQPKARTQCRSRHRFRTQLETLQRGPSPCFTFVISASIPLSSRPRPHGLGSEKGEKKTEQRVTETKPCKHYRENTRHGGDAARNKQISREKIPGEEGEGIAASFVFRHSGGRYRCRAPPRRCHRRYEIN